MGLPALFIHFLNFVAPALAVGTLMGVFTAWSSKKRKISSGLMPQIIQNTLWGVGVFAMGLWLFGNDGKMLSYAAMVLVVASYQWWCMRV